MPRKRLGRQTPTRSVILKYRQSRGGDAIDLYERTGRAARPWQKNMVKDMMAVAEKKELWNTPDKATQIKGAITALLVFLTALWGWVGWAIIIWIVCIVLDYISGTAAARRSGEWSSEVARDGLWHKLGEIFAKKEDISIDLQLLKEYGVIMEVI